MAKHFNWQMIQYPSYEKFTPISKKKEKGKTYKNPVL